jgi:hypothetical protein
MHLRGEEEREVREEDVEPDSRTDGEKVQQEPADGLRDPVAPHPVHEGVDAGGPEHHNPVDELEPLVLLLGLQFCFAGPLVALSVGTK